MSIIRNQYKQGTTEPRKFVIPTDLFQGNMFAQLADMLPKLDSKKELWPVEYTNFGTLIQDTATVFRFRHDADDATIKGFIDELIQKNMPRFTHNAQGVEGNFDYKPPYDKDTW